MHSKSESDDTPVFWSDQDGWGDLETATVFTLLESKAFQPAMSAGGDATWMELEAALQLNAEQLAAESQIFQR